MSGDEGFTIVAAVNNVQVLRSNLCLSPGLLARAHQLVIKENCVSASLAYNSAIEEADNDVIIFAHQDVYLPEGWFPDLRKSLAYLKAENVDWGVLGCFGCASFAEHGLGMVYTNGLGVHGRKIDKPEPIETLDEIVLIVRKSSGLRFDPQLPHFHLYGTDICLAAKTMGMTSYAIPAFCVHNTNQLLSFPAEFYQCYRYLKRKWARFLPIYTSCTRISRFDEDLYDRKFRELARKTLGIRRSAKLRVDDPRTVLGECGLSK